MNCEKALELFGDYADGRLSQGLREAVERHLAGCPACQVEFEHLTAILASIEAPATPPAPADIGERIARRLDRVDWERGASRRRARSTWLASVAAAAVLVIGFVFFRDASTGGDVLPAGLGLGGEDPFFGCYLLPGPKLAMDGVKGRSYSIRKGLGTPGLYPPPEAVEVESGRFADDRTVVRPLSVPRDGAVLWLVFEQRRDVLLVVLPEVLPTAAPVDQVPAGDFSAAAKQFADRYGVPVLARLSADRPVSLPSIRFTGDPAVDSRALGAAAGLQASKSDGTYMFR
jgi:hypothetical protein